MGVLFLGLLIVMILIASKKRKEAVVISLVAIALGFVVFIYHMTPGLEIRL